MMECVIWEGGTDSSGYGCIAIDGRARGVHRFVYEMNYGTVPEGMDVHHECGNRLCMNPHHLTLITHSEHSKLHNPIRSTCKKKGHPLTPENTYHYKDGHRACKVCVLERMRKSYAETIRS